MIIRKNYNGQSIWQDKEHSFSVRRTHNTGHIDLMADGEVSASKLREIGAALIAIADEIDPPHSQASIEQQVYADISAAIGAGLIEEVEPGKYRLTPAGHAHVENLLNKGQNN